MKIEELLKDIIGALLLALFTSYIVYGSWLNRDLVLPLTHTMEGEIIRVGRSIMSDQWQFLIQLADGKTVTTHCFGTRLSQGDKVLVTYNSEQNIYSFKACLEKKRFMLPAYILGLLYLPFLYWKIGRAVWRRRISNATNLD